MDKTVSPTLNDNTKVARWHETEQRCGFKFLVTQLMGYLTGGPQRYTGRPMDVAHKHLGISRLEWAEFTAVAERVLKDAGVHHKDSKELMEIIAGFEDLCTLRDGEIPCAHAGAGARRCTDLICDTERPIVFFIFESPHVKGLQVLEPS